MGTTDGSSFPGRERSVRTQPTVGTLWSSSSASIVSGGACSSIGSRHTPSASGSIDSPSTSELNGSLTVQCGRIPWCSMARSPTSSLICSFMLPSVAYALPSDARRKARSPCGP